MKKEFIVTKEFLDNNPNTIFIFGDNTQHVGNGGAAKLRNHPQSYGFITKIKPDNKDTSFYKPADYIPVFMQELVKLKHHIALNDHQIFLLSQLGAGYANKFNIYEEIIHDQLLLLIHQHSNIIPLWRNR